MFLIADRLNEIDSGFLIEDRSLTRDHDQVGDVGRGENPQVGNALGLHMTISAYAATR